MWGQTDVTKKTDVNTVQFNFVMWTQRKIKFCHRHTNDCEWSCFQKWAPVRLYFSQNGQLYWNADSAHFNCKSFCETVQEIDVLWCLVWILQWNDFECVLLQMVPLWSRNVHSHPYHHVHIHVTLGNGQKQGKGTHGWIKNMCIVWTDIFKHNILNKALKFLSDHFVWMKWVHTFKLNLWARIKQCDDGNLSTNCCRSHLKLKIVQQTVINIGEEGEVNLKHVKTHFCMKFAFTRILHNERKNVQSPQQNVVLLKLT